MTSHPASSRPTPRQWMAGEPFPWPSIAELADGERVTACYFVESVQLGMTRHEKPYLRMRLVDRTGAVEGRVWEDAERVAASLSVPGYAGIRGRVETYAGQRQLKVEEVVALDVPPEDLDLFVPRSPRDQREMEAELAALIAGVEDPAYRALLRRILGPDTETGRLFRHAPAAKRNHHAYIGGLLEHSLSVAGACIRLAEHYGERIDRDLLVTGALLHDIGKIREIEGTGGFPYTDEGKLLGHIVIGLQIVADEARSIPGLTRERTVLLLHLIASHQGRYEWQSPRRPKLLEALILHYVDDLDAKMQQVCALLDAIDGGWTAYDPALGREFFRHRAPIAVPAGGAGGGVGESGDAMTLDLFAL